MMGRRKRIYDEDEDSSDEQPDNGDDDLPEDDDLRDEAMLFRGRRRRDKGRGKEDAIYGVFAQDSDDDDPKSNRNTKPSSTLSTSRYDTAVKFVSSSLSSPSAINSNHVKDDVDKAERMNLDERQHEHSPKDTASYHDSDHPRRMPRSIPLGNIYPEDEDEGSFRPSFGASGLGFGAGFGFPPKSTPDPQSNSQPTTSTTSSAPNLSQPIQLKSNRDAAADLREFLTSTTSQTASPVAMRRQTSTSSNMSEPIATSTARPRPLPPPQSQSKRPDKDFGKFEKHTKGIGLKLLQKMGYVPGQGLGRAGEGITAPIDVKLRPSRMGLSFKDFDERTDAVKELKKQNNQDYNDENADTSKPKVKAKSKAWKKSASEKGTGEEGGKRGRGRRNPMRYKTVEELMQESMNEAAPASVLKARTASATATKIIDMTGKETRVLNDLSQAGKGALLDSTQRLPELRHNIRMVADLAESELLHLTRRLRIETTKQSRLEQDTASLSSMGDLEAQKIDRAKQMLALVEQASKVATRLTTSAFEPGQFPSLAPFNDTFSQLQTTYYEEYTAYSLMDAVVACLTPLMRRVFAYWEPLENPLFGRDQLLRYSNLLMPLDRDSDMNKSKGGEMEKTTEMTPYEAMMYTIWLPRVRQSINNDWDPKHPDPCIGLIEAWQPSPQSNLIPEWLYLNIIDQCVVPKLERVVEQWNPKRDTQPLHTWIHPWLPVLVPIDRMDSISELVRRRMAVALCDWRPDDPSALAVIRPWKDVFSQGAFGSLLSRSILPKLVMALRVDLDLNPQRSNIKPFLAVSYWHDLMGAAVTARLLETEFFGLWLDILYQWLVAPGAQYREIGEWYRVWKSQFPDDLIQEPGIAACFKAALTMMKAGIDGAPIPHPSTLVPEIFGAKGRRIISDKKDNASMGNVGASFKDYIEFAASQHNVSFVPVGPGRVHLSSGKPLYRLSNGLKGVMVYIDDGVLYCQTSSNGPFKPARVDDILASFGNSANGAK
ncbi:hypothetical protein SeMB42_g02861 [Synchytrium endobioticum]|uniref:G-patch domain-containing protein n=1 Tax=Synchytrium endobioticum TaxID=286115 RepID=A0A507D4T2_9FUNG|nr:hypothetical protein SeLEV6574_g03328 [Synchytrium endobioticum]TPX48783.1 hypothetical protein SeMB42_g02861 [Synchytrium endobioticum]